MDYAKENVDIERCFYDWSIQDFCDLFRVLNQRKKIASTAGRRNGKEKHVGCSDMELVSETFMRGQLVQRTSIWQLELRRNGIYLCVGLSCLNCFHENVDEIWTRFDIDIVDFNGKVCHSQGSGVHFCSDNITKFTPLTRIKNKTEARKNLRCSFWETDVISLNDLLKNWNKLAPMNILKLRLRLYIYRDKPFDEASHIAEYHEPVKLCYTDTCESAFSSPLLNAIKPLWKSLENADVIFVVEGVEMKAHKLIVSAYSPVLKKLTMNHRDETTPIEINAISLKVFEQVLRYMYTLDTTDLKASSDIGYIATVLEACNRFELPSLARICLVRLLTNMTVENFTETVFSIYSRVTKGQSFFKTEVKKFLMESQKELRTSETFKTKSLREKDSFLLLCFEPVNLIRNSSVPTN